MFKNILLKSIVISSAIGLAVSGGGVAMGQDSTAKTSMAQCIA